MTRYAPDTVRPQSTSQLTRFTQEYSRDEFKDVLEKPDVGTPAAPSQEVSTAAVAHPPRATATPQQPLPKTQVVQPAEAQPLRSTQADLYSDAPITISVLKRALPQRFAQVEAGITVPFNAPSKQNAQRGLTHAIRPLKSLFPHDPS